MLECFHCNIGVHISEEQEERTKSFYRQKLKHSFLFVFQISQRARPFERGVAKKHGEGSRGASSMGTPFRSPGQEGACDSPSDKRLCESRRLESSRPRENRRHWILAVSCASEKETSY